MCRCCVRRGASGRIGAAEGSSRSPVLKSGRLPTTSSPPLARLAHFRFPGQEHLTVAGPGHHQRHRLPGPLFHHLRAPLAARKQMVFAPLAQGQYDGEHSLSLFRQHILVIRTAIGSRLRRQDAGFHQPAQAVGQDVARDRQAASARWAPWSACWRWCSGPPPAASCRRKPRRQAHPSLARSDGRKQESRRIPADNFSSRP